MKRSEMLEIIERRLNPIGVWSDTCDELLTLLEEQGMKPPLAPIGAKVVIGWVNSTPAAYEILKEERAVWEAEDYEVIYIMNLPEPRFKSNSEALVALNAELNNLTSNLGLSIELAVRLARENILTSEYRDSILTLVRQIGLLESKI